MSEASSVMRNKVGLVVAGALIGFLVFWLASGKLPASRFPGTPSSVNEDLGVIFFGFLLGIGFHFAAWLLGKVLK